MSFFCLLMRDLFLVSLRINKSGCLFYNEILMLYEGQKHMYWIFSEQELLEIFRTLSEITKALNAFAIKERIRQSKKLKEEWIGSDRVMNLLGIQRRALQNLRDKGILPFSQVGGKFYYKVSDIRNLLESNYTRRGKKV